MALYQSLSVLFPIAFRTSSPISMGGPPPSDLQVPFWQNPPLTLCSFLSNITTLYAYLNMPLLFPPQKRKFMFPQSEMLFTRVVFWEYVEILPPVETQTFSGEVTKSNYSLEFIFLSFFIFLTALVCHLLCILPFIQQCLVTQLEVTWRQEFYLVNYIWFLNDWKVVDA